MEVRSVGVALGAFGKVENFSKFIATTANLGKNRLAWPRVRLTRTARSMGNLYRGWARGFDISAPAVNVHNENPSLVALGKKCICI